MAIRPLNGNPPISCNSACHVARGSAPGTDYGVSEGTVVISPFAGTVTIGFNSRAGDYTSVLSTTGIRVYLMHLKERMVTSGFVNEGQEIALSGGAAGAAYSGDSTGPHLHADIRDSGVQWGMEEWLAHNGNNAPDIPASSQVVADEQAYLNATFNAGLAVDGINGPATKQAVVNYQNILGVTADGIWGPATQAAHSDYWNAHHNAAPVSSSGNSNVAAVQQALKTNYPLYAGQLVVDGIVGPATIAAVKEFQSRSGLTVDGIAGPITRAALGL